MDIHGEFPFRYPYDRLGQCGTIPPMSGNAVIKVDYPDLLNNFPEHRDQKRSESPSFLICYLQHYYRLDAQEADDAVCDQSGDKGIDGIFVNDNDQTIIIFQSKISQRNNSIIGDAFFTRLSRRVTAVRRPETRRLLLSLREFG
jgi:hypothetical protein